jgi:hypothetical protein
MATRLLFVGLILFISYLPLSAYAGCQDMTICHVDPATGRKVCKTFKNVCSIIPFSQATPDDHGHSIELRGLSQDELRRVMDGLGVDQSKIKMP